MFTIPCCYTPSHTYMSIPVASQAYTTLLSQNCSRITVTNESSSTVEVLWIGVGLSCLRKWYGIMPFVCVRALLAPDETETNDVRGYMNFPVVLSGNSMCDIGSSFKDPAPEKSVYKVTNKTLKPIWDGGQCYPGVTTISDAICWIANKSRELPEELGGEVVDFIYKVMGVDCEPIKP